MLRIGTMIVAVLAISASGAMAAWTAPAPAAYINQGSPTGINDAVWGTANEYTINVIVNDAASPTYRTLPAELADCSGTWKGLWDSTNLYVRVTVTDDLHVNSATDWQGDCFEVYIDPNNDKSATYIPANKDTQSGIAWKSGNYLNTGYANQNIALTAVQSDNGGSLPNYTFMVTYVWAGTGTGQLNQTPSLNKLLGLSVYVCDCDVSGTREVQLGWGTNSGQLYTNQSAIPTVQLAPEPATLALLAIGGIGALIRRRRRS